MMRGEQLRQRQINLLQFSLPVRWDLERVDAAHFHSIDAHLNKQLKLKRKFKLSNSYQQGRGPSLNSINVNRLGLFSICFKIDRDRT